MIELGAAGSGENSTRVELKAGLVSLDGNADRVLRHCGGECVLVVGRNVLMPGDVDGGLAAGLAGPVGSLVRVVFLGADSVFLDVFEPVVH